MKHPNRVGSALSTEPHSIPKPSRPPRHPPRQVRGAIFASGLQREVFTAGNDIKELFAPLTSQERYT